MTEVDVACNCGEEDDTVFYAVSECILSSRSEAREAFRRCRSKGKHPIHLQLPLT